MRFWYELKSRFSKTDAARKADIRGTWGDLSKRGRSQDVEEWIQSWETTFDEGLQLGMSEMQDDNPIHTFLTAVGQVSAPFVHSFQVQMALRDPDLPYTEKDFRDVIQTYRIWRRNTKALDSLKPTGGAFPTTSNPSLQGNTATGDAKPSRPCLCKATHFYSQCPYLFDWNRSPDWKPDPSTQKLVDEQVSKSRRLQNMVRYKTTKHERGNGSQAGNSGASGAQSNTLPSAPAAPGALMAHRFDAAALRTAVPSITDPDIYPLRNSYILDSGATHHVCNDRSRFIDFTAAVDNERITTGDGVAQIKGYGTIWIKTKCPGWLEGRTIQLRNTYYVPTFSTNVVSLNAFADANVHFETRQERLEFEGETYCHVQRVLGQWLLEYHPLQEANTSAYVAHSSRKATPITKWTTQEAHQRLGHLYGEALQHLEKACRDVQLVDEEYQKPCQVCRLSDAKQQISRRPGTQSGRPFYRLHWDIIPQHYGLGDLKYVSHIYCEFLAFHFVYCVYSDDAKEIMWTIRTTANLIRRRWNFTVVIIRIDGQQSLLNSTEFQEYKAQTGITFEISAIEAHQQNGPAERSGGVLTIRGTKIHLESNLPSSLWSEIYPTAAYLLNRSPTRRLNWKSPLQALQEIIGLPEPRPLIGHLRFYGCKAYALMYNRPKLDRLEERAHIGYLVGYESTNIYRIWVPNLKRVLRIRDVTFDETQRYQPNNTPISQEITETIESMHLDVEDNNDITEPPRFIKDFERDAFTDTIVVDTSPQTSKEAIMNPKNQSTGQLTDVVSEHRFITPPLTPDPEATDQLGVQNQSLMVPEQPGTVRNSPTDSISSETTLRRSGRQRRKPQPFDEPLPSQRQPRRDVYHNHIQHLTENSAYNAAFVNATVHQHVRIHRSQLPDKPRTWGEMLKHPHSVGFLAAANQEYSDLVAKGTFTAVREEDAKAFHIPLMWVFSYKWDEEGYLLKYKARLVVRGDLQKSQLQETYAATLAARIFRCLMALTAHFDLNTAQFDAINAFPNALLDEIVYVKYPDGFKRPGWVYLVNRALYGLPRSPLLWYNWLANCMRKLGLRPVPECACLFTSATLIVFFYVDDIVILYHPSAQSDFDTFRKNMISEFQLRDMGELSWFLGIRVLRDRPNHKLWLSQTSYIEKVAANFGLDTRFEKTPMSTEPLEKYEGKATPHNIHKYQSKVGSIGYPATITRPDVARTHQKLSEYLLNPGPAHQEAADHCIAYLNKFKYWSLEFGGVHTDPALYVGADASFADDTPTRRSTEGYLFKLFRGCIDWRSALQPTVTKSTTEAELLAASHVADWFIWWRRFFDNIDLNLDEETTIHCDNLQTVRLLMKEAPKLVTKLKHVDIHQHWLRQETEAGTLKFEWVGSNEMPADGLTKALSAQKQLLFLAHLNMTNVELLLKAISQ